jgi:hypothetical protein
VFVILLSVLMLPSATTLVPSFILWHYLHGLDTFLPLIVPAFFGNSFFIFLLRQFFRGIPRELEDAAHRWRRDRPHVLGHHPYYGEMVLVTIPLARYGERGSGSQVRQGLDTTWSRAARVEWHGPQRQWERRMGILTDDMKRVVREQRLGEVAEYWERYWQSLWDSRRSKTAEDGGDHEREGERRDRAGGLQGGGATG